MQTAPSLLTLVTHRALYLTLLFSVVSITASQGCLLLALLTGSIDAVVHGRVRQLRWPLIVPLSGFLLASLIAVLASSAPLAGLDHLRYVFQIGMLFLVVNTVHTEKHASSLVHLLIAAGTVMALYGLWQAMTHGADFRVRGTMHYMTFSGILMIVVLLAVAQVTFEPIRRRLLWCGPAVFVLLAALLMTRTRNAWLGLLAGLCIILGYRKKVLLLALPPLVVVSYLLAPQVVRERLHSFVNFQDITLQERLYQWRAGLDMIRHHPFTGIGMGTMERMYLQYRHPDDPSAPGRRYGHLHNNFIQVAAEVGLIGFGFWLSIWIVYFRHTWRTGKRLPPHRRQARALVVGSMASMAALLVAGCFEYNFGDAEVILLGWFSMALPYLAPLTELDG
jgi:O-antigen ligase